ncbi:hypothetical protein HYU16_00450 [Candidatus Woesearchaeota archaeon]|nr:hypothetical protein [Candidatus Woesearchaeota archaeon]
MAQQQEQNSRQPSPNEDLAAKIRQIEEETRGEKNAKAKEERIRALLKPMLGGRTPEELIQVCHLEHSSGSFSQHTYYGPEAENLKGATLPNPAAIPPSIAQLFRETLEPCLQHLIEFSIGVTGAHIGQKKIVQYELLPTPARNPADLEEAVAAATRDYSLTTKDIAMPTYMKERKRVVSAVLFKNASLYQNENARRNVVKLLQQIDGAISLQKEGKASREEVRVLIDRLKAVPTEAQREAQQITTAPQQPQPEMQASTGHAGTEAAHMQDWYGIPAKLRSSPEDINLFLRRFEQPYEVNPQLQPGGLGIFRFTKPGQLERKGLDMMEKAVSDILWLDNLIGMFRSQRTKEGQEQALQQVIRQAYERFGTTQT